MGNNFEAVQCTLLNKLISPCLLYLKKNVGQVVIMEWMLIFRYMEKEEGEVAGCHCHNSSFISMIICLLVFLSLFLSFSLCLLFLCLLVCSFSSPFKGTTSIWMEYRKTLLGCLCLHLFWHTSIVQSLLCQYREISKAIAVSLLHCHMAINNNSATMKWFHTR